MKKGRFGFQCLVQKRKAIAFEIGGKVQFVYYFCAFFFTLGFLSIWNKRKKKLYKIFFIKKPVICLKNVLYKLEKPIFYIA